jgi:hypothetical protein
MYTFYKYLLEDAHEHDLLLFSKYFNLVELPLKVCSSKQMFKIFKPQTQNEVNALRETYSNYFKHKVGSIVF